jgi:hypothetical protein
MLASLHQHHLPRMLVVSLLTLVIAACGMNLREAPVNQNLLIEGRWQLQNPDSTAWATSLRAVMDQAQAKQDKRFRKHMQATGELEDEEEGRNGIRVMAPTPDSADNDKGSATHGPRDRRNSWQAREQRARQEALLKAVLPSKQLQISQSSSRIEFIPDNGVHRSFDMGETSTLVSSYATFKIESGWQKNVFVVHSRDAEQGINIIERYQRQGDVLALQVQLSLPDAKDQLFSASYTLLR